MLPGPKTENMFQPDQKVICIDVTSRGNGETDLIKDKVYTIKRVTTCANCGAPQIDLKGDYDNPPHLCTCGYISFLRTYFADRFISSHLKVV